MESRVIECVPNFSEGRDPAKIKQITAAIEGVSGVQLLDVDPGADTNRTVVTFVGSPDAVAEAAFVAIARASQVIDMSRHHGAHPRIGATDVCPFVPVSGVTLQDCAAIAARVGKRVGEELQIPVYLYEAAATKPERRNLATVRKGEYEGLADKLKDPDWAPDFGPARFDSRAGATIIGAREFLIAYNVTLNTRDKSLATDIAFELREKGRVARRGNVKPNYSKGQIVTYKDGVFPCGNCAFDGKSFDETAAHCRKEHGYDLAELLRGNDLDPSNVVGQKVYRAGKFHACKAIGWYVDQYKRAQISINLTNARVTPPHLVLEEARRLASERGLVVTGSEIVGLIPFHALHDAGRHYLRAQGKSPFVPVPDVLETAVFSMGLADIAPFEISKKVIGLPPETAGNLAKMRVRDFVDEVSRDTPAPGGGSIAALAGALGAALASMVANLTHGRTDSAERDAELLAIAESAQKLAHRLVLAIDEDTAAFNGYMEARRLPATTDAEKAHREAHMQAGLKTAVEVPLETARHSLEAMTIAERAAIAGNPASITDAAVGCAVAHAGVRGGVWNVLVNLKDLKDEGYVAGMRSTCADLVKRANEIATRTNAYVDGKL